MVFAAVVEPLRSKASGSSGRSQLCLLVDPIINPSCSFKHIDVIELYESPDRRARVTAEAQTFGDVGSAFQKRRFGCTAAMSDLPVSGHSGQ
jgi:hypothetical protein